MAVSRSSTETLRPGSRASSSRATARPMIPAPTTMMSGSSRGKPAMLDSIRPARYRGSSMPEAAQDPRIDELLAGLNPPQRDAVVHGEGPLLILAGAGSGKTRVLTHRIAYLMRTEPGARGRDPRDHVHQQGGAGDARAGRAAGRPRHPRDVGDDVPLRLRADAARRRPPARLHAPVHDLRRGRPAAPDQAAASTTSTSTPSASPRARCSPRSRTRRTSSARAEDYRQLVGSYFEQTVADVYEQYERELHRMNAMDFDDLLVRSVNLLELFQEVRDRYAAAFRWILVDEYQDTNHAQYRWLQLLASEHRNLAVVGDDDQCLVEGTPITMGDGSIKPIEEVRGRRRGAVVLRQRRLPAGAGDADASRLSAAGASRSRTRGGRAHRQHARARALRRLPARRHAADAHDVPDVAPRQGLPRRDHATYDRSAQARRGVALRAMQESADARWVVSTHDSMPRRGCRRRSSRCATASRRCPSSRGRAERRTASSATRTLIDRIFASVDTRAGGRALLLDTACARRIRTTCRASFEGRRRNVTVTLCGDRRGRTPMHTVAVGGRDPRSRARARGARAERPAGQGRIGELALRVVLQGLRRGDGRRRADPGGDARVTSAASRGSGARERGDAQHAALHPAPAPSGRAWRCSPTTAATTSSRASSASRSTGPSTTSTSSTPTTSSPAGSSRTTRSTASAAPTSRTSSIFEDDFPDAHVVKLEQNYRSTQTILSAANAVVANNRGRMAKALWTEIGEGDPIKVRELSDEHAEARYVAAEIERMVDEGVSREEIAVFYRTNAQSRVLEDMLVRAQIGYQVIGGTKFYERAEIRDAVGVPHVPRQPAGRGGVHARRQLAASAGSGRRRSRACSRTRTRWASPSGRRRRSPRPCPALGTAAQKALGRFMSTMERLRERAESGAPVGDLLDELLRETGYLDALRGRADDRGAGPDREPRGARARRRASTTRPAEQGSRRRSSCSRSRCSPTPTRCATTRGS